ncbi:DUF3144 domain-containing protein [Mannheimia indoligenes]|uniref:DUF3144 domain-containing protein n=1 Tax=Mannheimia indoligenes TaxID=3103145 RepID=UPI002FE68C05
MKHEDMMINITDKQIDPTFYQRADGFINIANAHLQNIAPTQVSNAMLFACARFNAYVAASKAEYKQQLADSREEVIQYFVEQYKEMLTANLDEYIHHFERYIEGKKAD